ncbi:E3 ubiquitin-protein ligase TRIM56-like [Patella vulgata]|uniref:E3 ubiquitin-protein ligase TRIM56-like n=1 Tax=Patella vulgata TaxID=6465 RepID=UPI0021808BD7|nr:E3 ubiquitin-protein ligase TRIM56-like [Patella vulgata]
MATFDQEKPVCSICLNEFQQPKIIDCQHSFCLNCLEDYINKVSTNNQFPCPLCRNTVSIPTDGVMGFASNVDVQQELASDICKTEVPPCDVCKTGVDSEFRCEDCEQYLCKSCRTTHDGLKSCRGHVILDVRVALQTPGRGTAESKSKDICPNHHDKEVRCYCKDCSTAVCSDCFVTNHISHKFVDLYGENIDVETRDELKVLQDDIETQISQFEKFCKSLTKIKTDIEYSAKTSCDAVDQQIEQICSEAKQAGEEIKAEIQKSRDEEIEKIMKLLEEMEILIADLKASVKCTGGVIEDTSIVQVLNRIPQVKQEKEESGLRKLDIPDVKYTWFEQSVIDKTLLVKQLGCLLYQEESTFTTSFNLDEVESESQGYDGVYGEDHYIQGLPWYIGAVKKEETNTVPTLCVYLELNDTEDTADIKSCKADLRFTLINIKDKQQSLNRESNGSTYEPGYGRGWPGFIEWDRLSDKENGFLDDDNNFTVQTTVKIIKIERN